MMDAPTANSELQALNRVLTRLRWLAGEKADHVKLYAILDRVEILPTYIEHGQSEEFREVVRDLAEAYPEFRSTATELVEATSPTLESVGK